MARNLEEIEVYGKAIEGADAVSALLERPVFCKDLELKDQLSRSSGRIPPLIAEGFGQLTDKHVAVYLGRARGSSLEMKGHLRRAFGKKFISRKELDTFDGLYTVIGKMLTRWIHYLQRCDWKKRG